jgi:hypothetical protein
MHSSAESQSKRPARKLGGEFGFIPKALALKCRRLIETYHAKNGYACLPDALWQPELQEFVETHKEIAQIFKRAAVARNRC